MNNWPGRRVEDDRSLYWCQSDRLYWVLRLKRIYPRAAYYHIISRSGDLQQQSSEPWPQARPDDGLTTGCRLDQLTPHRRDYPWNTDYTVTSVNYFRDNFPSLLTDPELAWGSHPSSTAPAGWWSKPTSWSWWVFIHYSWQIWAVEHVDHCSHVWLRWYI